MANYDKAAATAEERFCNELTEAERVAGMDLLCRLFPVMGREAGDPTTARAVDGFISIVLGLLRSCGAGLLLNAESTLQKLGESLRTQAPTITAYMKLAAERTKRLSGQ